MFAEEKTVKGTSSLPSRLPLTTGQLVFRLGLAFGLLVGILILVGAMGLRRMNHIYADLQNITGKQWTKLHLSREALTYSNRNNRITMQIFLIENQEQVSSLVAARNENASRITALIAELERSCESDEEKRLLRVIQNKRTLYSDSYARALRLLVNEGKRDTALAVMTGPSTAALVDYQEAWDDFVRFQGEQFELSARESRVRFAEARRLAMTANRIVSKARRRVRSVFSSLNVLSARLLPDCILKKKTCELPIGTPRFLSMRYRRF